MTLYVFDPVGNLTSNRIRNEIHTINNINGVDHNYIVPVNAPFYDTSVVVVDLSNGQALVENIDYFYAYNFIQATERVGSPISGAIALVDKNRTGNFAINYQTLGGEYVNEETQAIANGLDTLVRLASRHWEDITNIPPLFPPTPHTHRVDGVVGVQEILAKFTSLEAAIKSPERHITLSDITDINEGYVVPLVQSMAHIAASITALSTNTDRYYIERNMGTVLTTLTAIPRNTWVDTGLEITPAFTGTYQIFHGGNAYPLSAVGKPLTYRFLVNNEAITQSSINGTILGLSAGDIVKLQIRHSEPTDDSIVLANNDVSCGLSLVRLSL